MIEKSFLVSIEYGENYYCEQKQYFDYHIYLNYKGSCKQLIVMFNGAVDRKRSELPVFQRKTWAEDINANVLIFDDPTLQLDQEMTVGWYMGTEYESVKNSIVYFVTVALKVLNTKEENLVFFGSSAGGFAAMMMGRFFKKATIVVNNPQVDLDRYYKRFVLLVRSLGFKTKNIPEEDSNFLKMILKYGFHCKLYYYQNLSDLYHYERHLLYLLKELSVNNIDFENFLTIHLYSNHHEKHNPLSKKDTLRELSVILSSSTDER